MIDPSSAPAAILNILQPYLAQGGQALSLNSAGAPLADLEISLHRRDGSAYSLETRFTPPGSAAEMRLGANELITVDLDEQGLLGYAKSADWIGYGRALSQALFSAEAVKLAFAQALARAGAAPLRLRLLLGPTAQALHRLHWETLRSPLDDAPLAGGQNILFSRYLAGEASSKEVSARPRTHAAALIAAANPRDLEQYGLAIVDSAGEIERARRSLDGVQTTALPDGAEGCTLPNLARRLQDGYDILYLVAHGSLNKGQAWLWLENAAGETARLSGAELAAQVRLLDRPPLLAVLASCESAGDGEGDALQALGPLLCEAGIPAVIAMQGKISIDSVARLMPVFFEKLLQDGQVDRALASARAVLAAGGAMDLWMPALFMRLKDGALWQAPKESAPPPVIKLWGLIQAKFQARAAAQEALHDLLSDPEEPDFQEAFSLQLKKAMREDPGFAEELTASLAAGQKPAPAAGTVINVQGNVVGGITFGNNNTIVGENYGNIQK